MTGGISGTYLLSGQENAREFLQAMGAPDAYIDGVLNAPKEEFVILENEDGTITLGQGERKNTVTVEVPYEVSLCRLAETFLDQRCDPAS